MAVAAALGAAAIASAASSAYASKKQGDTARRIASENAAAARAQIEADERARQEALAFERERYNNDLKRYDDERANQNPIANLLLQYFGAKYGIKIPTGGGGAPPPSSRPPSSSGFGAPTTGLAATTGPRANTMLDMLSSPGGVSAPPPQDLSNTLAQFAQTYQTANSPMFRSAGAPATNNNIPAMYRPPAPVVGNSLAAYR